MVSPGPAALNGTVPDNLPVISRPKDGAMLAGVCVGLARRWRVDPNLLRISIAVLAFFGGLGLAAYAGGMLLMPRDGQVEMPIRRLLPFTRTWSTPVVVAATVGFLLVLVSVVGGGSLGIGPVLVIAAIWFFGFRNKGPVAPPPEPTPFERAAEAWRVRMTEQHTPGYESVPTPLAAPSEARWTQPYTDPATDLAVRDDDLVPAVPPPVPRRSWRLWWLALASVAVSVTAVFVLGVLGLATGPLAYAAAVLAGLGLTLVAATWSGRPPLLIPATIVAALATIALAFPSGPGLGPVGSITQTYTDAATLPTTFSLTAGDVDLDLSGMRLTEDRDLAIRVGTGSVTVNLPDDATSEVDWRVGVGDFDSPTDSRDGFDLQGSTTFAGKHGGHTLRVTISVDVGDVEVLP